LCAGTKSTFFNQDCWRAKRVSQSPKKEIIRGAKLAGLPVIRIHDLRHSHASLLISCGVDIATVSNRLGHEKVTTTLNTYSHMFNDKAKGVADMLDDLYCSEEN
jgi:integrase